MHTSRHTNTQTHRQIETDCRGIRHELSGTKARLAQSAERKALNIVVAGSSPTVGAVSAAVDDHGTDGSTRGRTTK